MSVQASPRDRASWLALSKEVEELGFDGLYVADHPGSGPAPFVALAAAAAVTDRIRVGTCVANAGTWEPLALAGEVASLDGCPVVGRCSAWGAGHTPTEWTSIGRSYPSPGQRVDRMVELTGVTQALLAGDPISYRGSYFTLVDAALKGPRPVQEQIPFLVGGNGARLLRFAAQSADIVGISGLGRTLADGHQHEVDWNPAALTRVAEIVATTADQAGRSPQIEALVQHVEVTDDAEAAAVRLAPHVRVLPSTTSSTYRSSGSARSPISEIASSPTGSATASTGA